MPQNQEVVGFEDFELRLDESSSDTLIIAATSIQGQADGTVSYQEITPLEASPASEQEAEALGRRLMDVLFPAEIRYLYERCLGAGHRLRILISLPSESRLHRLPFELLHDGKRHLARDDRTNLVRFLRVKEARRWPGVEAPLRMLFTTACPSGYGYLNLRAEEDAVRQALLPYGDSVKLEVLRSIDLDKLDNAYRGAKSDGKPFHLWHHGGHGCLGIEGDFHLVLHDNSQIPSTRLHELLSQNPALRLAVINTCHSGAPLGLATMLARLEVPAAIGTASALYDSTAIGFTKAFYHHPNLRQLSVEEAVSQARSRLQSNVCPLAWSKILVFSRYCDIGPVLTSSTPGFHASSRESTHVVEVEWANELRQKTTPDETIFEAKGIKGFSGNQRVGGE